METTWSTIAIVALAALLVIQWSVTSLMRREAFKWRARWITARFGIAVHGTEGDYYVVGLEAGGGRCIIFRKAASHFTVGTRVRKWSDWMGPSSFLSTCDMPDEQSLGLND